MLPGGTLCVPLTIGHAPLMLIVTRELQPRHTLCSLAVVSTVPSHHVYHPTLAEPPKLKVQTALELHEISFDRLLDESAWTAVWVATSGTLSGAARTSATQLFFEFFLPLVAEESLDSAILRSEERRSVLQLPPTELRTTRCSASDGYGCARHTWRYLLRQCHLSAIECKRLSLLLRLQTIELAARDVGFMQHIDPAGRNLLKLACRRLAHKASSLAARPQLTSGAGLLSAGACVPSEAGACMPSEGAVEPMDVEEGKPVALTATDLAFVRGRI